MQIFLIIAGVVWLLFAGLSLANWATIIPTNIMHQIYQQNALLMAVVQVSFALVFFAAASIISRLGNLNAGQAPEAIEDEPAQPDARLRVRPVS
jgi:hypothetical protein